ncbi:MAG TPA: TIGR01212 family radical SAM protein [Candidatus Rifleibacterium sp.]|nr:TIGR01212 family radical SAM protein [Candidatus Rifleibacterium sp.]
MNKPLFNSAANYYQKTFGGRVQKIPVDAGFSCPNRDGTLSTTGCIYCSNRSFSPFYVTAEKTVREQLQTGIRFFSSRYGCNRFFAYFQTFSGTSAPIETLHRLYREALSVEGIEGLVIATRPDCLGEDVVELLRKISDETYLRIELGIESFENRVLQKINRCHDVQTSLSALARLKQARIENCVHLIFGLPEESPQAPENSARIVSEFQTRFVKLHHLQIVRDTIAADLYQNSPEAFKLHTPASYVSLLTRFISHLSADVYIERFLNRVPTDFLIAPRWGGITETDFRQLLETEMTTQNLWQGKICITDHPQFSY